MQHARNTILHEMSTVCLQKWLQVDGMKCVLVCYTSILWGAFEFFSFSCYFISSVQNFLTTPVIWAKMLLLFCGHAVEEKTTIKSHLDDEQQFGRSRCADETAVNDTIRIVFARSRSADQIPKSTIQC